MPGPFTLTWTGTEIDEEVYSFEVSQQEAEAASLKIVIVNPRYPLLSGELWATLVYNNGTSTVTLFYGRLIGIPSDIQNEFVNLEFIAKPDNFEDQKAALAETLKVPPYWDLIFITADQQTNPDTVLDAYNADWHTDRVTHVVTVSNTIAGEDGTASIIDHTYSSLDFSYREAPAYEMTCKATIQYNQQATDTVDFTDSIYEAFSAVGSVDFGFLSSYTGGGLLTSWPKPGASIGGGWSVGDGAVAERVDGNFAPDYMFVVGVSTGGMLPENTSFVGVTVDQSSLEEGDIQFDAAEFKTGEGDTTQEVTALISGGYYGKSPEDKGGPMSVGFPLWSLYASLPLTYKVERQRIEAVEFTMIADVQPIVTEGVEPLTLDLSSQQVDQPIDPGGALPIGDLRRTSYMLTDRGHQTLQYLITRCRASLVAKARAAIVSCEIGFDDAISLTLRQSRTIVDDRIPGGQAIGKVTSYSFSVDGDAGTAKGSVSIACLLGRGNELTVPEGVPTYVEVGYVEPGYQVTTGGGNIVLPDVYYEDYDSTVIADDGINFFDMRPEDLILDLNVINGAVDQQSVLAGGTPPTTLGFVDSGSFFKPFDDSSAVVSAINEAATTVALNLKPLTVSEPFKTSFPITVSTLAVPKTLDLEA